MRLLQIANVPTRLGGTGACAYDVTRALVGHEHRILFTRPTRPDTSDHFECETAGPELHSEWRDWADAVLCHNVAPQFIRDKDVYYTHSRRDLSFVNRIRLKAIWCVSKWLAKLCNAGVEVVYQPVSPPPAAERSDSVLRICTPTGRKWQIEDLERHYRAVSAGIPAARFVFVGCPKTLHQTLTKWCAPRPVEFHHASVSARRFFSSARVLLYTSSVKETYGRTVCEAQQAGCVPVVSNHSGLAEQVIHGVDGFTVADPAESVCAVQDAFSRFDSLSRDASTSGAARGSLTHWSARFFEVLS